MGQIICFRNYTRR